MFCERWKEEGGRRKEEGGRRKEEGGKKNSYKQKNRMRIGDKTSGLLFFIPVSECSKKITK